MPGTPYGTLFEGTVHGTLFEATVPVAMEITFYMKRPLKDFKNGNREVGNLKHSIPNGPTVCVPDIDNMAKFVLDACNGLLYQDDRQVVKLTLLKLRDNDGLCNGRTVLDVKEYCT